VHPLTLTSANNLLLVLEAKGTYKTAEEMLREALDCLEKAIGKEHPFHADEFEQPHISAAGSGQVRCDQGDALADTGASRTVAHRRKFLIPFTDEEPIFMNHLLGRIQLHLNQWESLLSNRYRNIWEATSMTLTTELTERHPIENNASFHHTSSFHIFSNLRLLARPKQHFG